MTDEREGHEGRRPSLSHSLAEDLRHFGLRLQTGPQQKPGEKRDKNSGRKVVTLPNKERNQEVRVMEETVRSENNESMRQPMPSTEDSVVRDQRVIASAVERLYAKFDSATSLQREGIRLGAYVLGTTAAVTGGILIANAIINRGTPELPSGITKK